MRDVAAPIPLSQDSGLVDTIICVMGEDALSPEDILVRVRREVPGLTLERLLITLYENSAQFHRRRGHWYLVGIEVHDHWMTYPDPTLSA